MGSQAVPSDTVQVAVAFPYLVRFQEAHVLAQLLVARVFAVWHQVYGARPLATRRECRPFHLIHPASGDKTHHLHKDGS